MRRSRDDWLGRRPMTDDGWTFRFHPDPRTWFWQSYTSPSGKFRMLWRGPLVLYRFKEVQ